MFYLNETDRNECPLATVIQKIEADCRQAIITLTMQHLMF